ncbi:MAG: HlyD family efflux transporter periplasmic adaptor subunit [Planctomycetota bacterium]
METGLGVVAIAAGSAIWVGVAGLAPLHDQPDRFATASARAASDEAFGVKAVTRPSRDATMGFPFPTSVVDVIATDGMAVSEGQLLIRADDAEAVAAFAIGRIRAVSTLDVDLQVKTLELAEVELRATETAFEGGGGSTIELDRAKLTRDQSEIQLEAAKQRDVEADNQLIQLEARVGDHRLEAPFDGVVDVVFVDVGDSVRDTDPAVRVVSVDPLWIDVATPTAQTLSLGPGDPAWVRVRIGDEPRVLPATIVGISPVADSVTGARRVRVEAPNPDGLPAGLTAFVRFEPPTPEMTGGDAGSGG